MNNSYLTNFIADPASSSVNNEISKSNNKEHEGEEVGLANVFSLECRHGSRKENGQ